MMQEHRKGVCPKSVMAHVHSVMVGKSSASNRTKISIFQAKRI